MAEWYVFLNGQRRGPGDTEALLRFLQTNDPARVYVWRAGFDDWRPASEVPELRVAPPPPAAAPGAAPAAAQKKRRRFLRWGLYGAIGGSALALIDVVTGGTADTDAADLASYVGASIVLFGLGGMIAGAMADAIGGGNFVARHWRGELKLWVAYWIIAFVGYLAVVAVIVAAPIIFNVKSGYYPPGVFAAYATGWIAIAAITTWQIVGVWRSAKRYKADKRRAGRSRFWGIVAQAACVLGVTNAMTAFWNAGLPQLGESYRMAFHNDPGIPDYAIRLMRDGTEAEIVGGFKYGLTDDFAKILAASSKVKVVHLDSIGGRLGEGQRMFELIRERGLDTYVSSRCLSACTLAFAGGKARYLRDGAVLGFHRGAFPGVKESDFDDLQAEVFRRAGFDPSFIRTALTTPHKEMWHPGSDVLVKARVITEVSDGAQFAYSGLGTTDLSRESVSKRLVNAGPALKAMQELFPQEFATLVDAYHGAITGGKSDREAIELLQARFLPFLRSVMPLADDDVVVEYARLMVDQYVALSAKDVTSCYRYVSGEGASGLKLDFSDELVRRGLALNERAMRTAAKREPLSESAMEALWERIKARLARDGVSSDDLDLLSEDKVDRSLHAKYCSVAIALYRQISRLPQGEAAAVMRSIWVSR